MRSCAVRQRVGGLALAALTLGGSALALSSAASAAPPSAAAVDHHYECDNTYPGEDAPDSLTGEGCSQSLGGMPGEGIYVRDWGGPDDWVCGQVVVHTDHSLTGRDCRPADSGEVPGT